MPHQISQQWQSNNDITLIGRGGKRVCEKVTSHSMAAEASLSVKENLECVNTKHQHIEANCMTLRNQPSMTL